MEPEVADSQDEDLILTPNGVPAFRPGDAITIPSDLITSARESREADETLPRSDVPRFDPNTPRRPTSRRAPATRVETTREARRPGPPDPAPAPAPDPGPVREIREIHVHSRRAVTRHDVEISLRGPRCPFCHETVAQGEREQLACNKCRAWHHQDCWTEAGSRCSACGSKATGLYVPGSRDGLPTAGAGAGLARLTAPFERLRASANTLPSWIWGMALALITLALAVAYAIHVGSGSRFDPWVVAYTLTAAVSVWSFVVAGWARSGDPNDPGLLGLPPLEDDGDRSPEEREAIAARFQQSVEHFRESDLSLAAPSGLDLPEALVICAERVERAGQLLSVLSPVSLNSAAPPVVLFAEHVSDGVLELFATNVGQGTFGGFVLHAGREELAEVALACGARRVRSGRSVSCRDVGRARLRLDESGLDVVGAGAVVRVPFRELEPAEEAPTRERQGELRVPGA